MTGFGYDPHDREWETGDGFRTIYVPHLDDDWCEECETDDHGHCLCFTKEEG